MTWSEQETHGGADRQLGRYTRSSETMWHTSGRGVTGHPVWDREPVLISNQTKTPLWSGAAHVGQRKRETFGWSYWEWDWVYLI